MIKGEYIMIIGLTCSEKREMDHPSQATNEDYIHAVVESQGVPVMLPICDDEDVILKQIECIKGLIVVGGIDVNPMIYHEPYLLEQGESSTRRDLYEIKLIQECANRDIPILGICRGIQIINVAFGGTLYQDNRLASSLVNQHQQKERKDYPVHLIQVKENTFLYDIVGKEYYVNSFHHQSVKRLAEGFMIVAKSSDGIIEAIQHKEKNIWGVQFHPEMMHRRDEKMLDIFKAFIHKCEEVERHE